MQTNCPKLSLSRSWVSYLLRIFILIFLLFPWSSFGAEKHLTEIIHFQIDNNGVTFWVPTGGCTGPEDFKIQTKTKDNTLFIYLLRLNADYCKGFFPEGFSIFFSFEELGFSSPTKVEVQNPVNPYAQPR